MLERWELERKLAELNVRDYQESIVELSRSPKSELQLAWASDKIHAWDKIKEFSGLEDPAYIRHVEKRYAEGLRRSKYRLKKIMKARP